MSGNLKALKAYDFLLAHSNSRNSFTIKELADNSDWQIDTARTYVTKKWRDYLIAEENKQFRVKAKFKRLSSEQFLSEFTQTESIETSYVRQMHTKFVQFEFLLPLTREDKLRRALDDIFYKDTIKMRIQDIGLEALEKVIARESEPSDEMYIDKVCEQVSNKFGGYSISHVQGRYKAADLMTRKEAAEYFAQDQLYLIDETTASVRFIVPCENGSSNFDDDFDSINQVAEISDTELEREVSEIRTLFFQFFVEAVVATIHGEEEIWLLETGHVRKLYRWRRSLRIKTKKEH
jgi:hypothetical protein